MSSLPCYQQASQRKLVDTSRASRVVAKAKAGLLVPLALVLELPAQLIHVPAGMAPSCHERGLNQAGLPPAQQRVPVYPQLSGSYARSHQLRRQPSLRSNPHAQPRRLLHVSDEQPPSRATITHRGCYLLLTVTMVGECVRLRRALTYVTIGGWSACNQLDRERGAPAGRKPDQYWPPTSWTTPCTGYPPACRSRNCAGRWTSR